jgi:hypothetical protein
MTRGMHGLRHTHTTGMHEISQMRWKAFDLRSRRTCGAGAARGDTKATAAGGRKGAAATGNPGEVEGDEDVAACHSCSP